MCRIKETSRLRSNHQSSEAPVVCEKGPKVEGIWLGRREEDAIYCMDDSIRHRDIFGDDLSTI